MRQLDLFQQDFSHVVKSFAQASPEERGAIFTRHEVVEFILDLVGYTTDHKLYNYRLVEPSFGEGDFLLPIVSRLLASYKENSEERFDIVEDLGDAIRAVEINRESINSTRSQLLNIMQDNEISENDAHLLIDNWIIEGDFLLLELPFTFTHAIGNPPYIRQEQIPDILLTEYRKRYATIYDRADLYIPFIESCLANLSQNGILGFICSDRWMKNKYGQALRAMIAKDYNLEYYIDMVDTPAFTSEVIAYPAITVIKRATAGLTRIARRPQICSDTLSSLVQAMQSKEIPKESGVIEVAEVSKHREPWILQSFDQLAVVRRLEAEFPSLEESGCKVSIGVATGADKVYIKPFENLDVELDRKLPIVKTKDIQSGIVRWQGLGVINPFNDDGSLVDLSKYPRLAKYFELHSDTIKNRNCAKKNPTSWYRTIDRIYPALMHRPKLLIPDIKGDAHIVYEDGQLYPHHNLYFITSDDWNLKALQAVLQTGIARLFVSVYSIKMRGGYFRFQAQYLRRIRLPRWQSVPEDVKKALIAAANVGDIEACNNATFDLYRLSPSERIVIGSNGKLENKV